MSTSRNELSLPITSTSDHGDGGSSEEVSNTSRPLRDRKRKTSKAWDHFTIVQGVDNTTCARCNHCSKLLAGQASSGTTHLLKHLQNACPNFKLDSRTGSSPRSEFKFDQIKSRNDWAIATIKHKYSFNMVEHEYFEKFLNGLNPDFKLPCRNTVRDDVIQIHEERKGDIYKLINGLQCKVSVTTDIWTEKHTKVAYNCLTCHYIDDTWQLHKKALVFKNFPYPHDGDALFNFMRETILDWGLQKKLLAVVVDNATANDVMIRKLKDWLGSDSLIGFDGDLLHVRCSAHILNLIVQDGLNRIRGLIEKIRETVRYLNKSPAAMQKFESAIIQCNLEDAREVAMDIPSRWNSTYKLLETALPLKEAFCRLERIDKNYRSNPSESEWKVAKVVHGCLEIFFEATRHFSCQKFPTSNVFFPDVCEIQLRLSEWMNSEHDYIRQMCIPMKEKFDKYWDVCCIALGVAVVFDPRFKMQLVEYFYTKIYGSEGVQSYIYRVRGSLDKLFIEYGGSLVPVTTNISTETSSSSISTRASLRDFDQWCDALHAPVNEKSELDTYLEEPKFPRTDAFNILDWWKTNSPRLPILSKIARDILAVPATTVASEAAFSVGGRTIDPSRSCLGQDVVEALIVTDDWI